VWSAQARLDVPVAAVDSYCESPQTESVPQARFEVAVGAVTWY